MGLIQLLAAQASTSPDPFARWLAAGSFTLATCGLLVSVLAFRRDRLNVKVRIGGKSPWHRIPYLHSGVWYPVTAVNKGRVAVGIESSWWEVKSKDWPRIQAVDTREGVSLLEPPEQPFPVDLSGMSKGRWVTRARGWDSKQRGTSIYRVRYCVRLGNDREVRSSWLLARTVEENVHITARQMDRAAFPRLWRPVREILRTKRATERRRERWRDRPATHDNDAWK